MNIETIKSVYFVGAGGIGMSALIRYFLSKGKFVAGYDRTPSELTGHLIAEGAQIHYEENTGLIPENCKDKESTLVVYTPAIPQEHAELAYFRENGFEIHKRSQVLGTITRSSKGLCVAGTHGKTTTSTMAAHLFHQSHVGCTAFLGGISKNYGTNLLLSPTSPYTVIEADEFDRSFHWLSPYMSVITSTDPDHLDWKPEDMDTKTYLGSFRKVRNAYPLMTVGGVYDHQREVTSDKRVFILTRSGFLGQQRYGANVWSGDVASTWESFRNQIPAGLNFSLCGMPHWNSDIGGFFAGHYNKSWNDDSASKNPLYQELYVRWLQFGTFNPMMRSHGTDVYREIYKFGKKGEPVYDAIEKMIGLRYSLLPYIYSTSWEVSNRQSSFMRALMMDFVDDRKVWDINDEYMFGKSLLVAPIAHAQYTPEAVVKVSEEEGWNRDGAKKTKTDVAVDFMETKSTNIYLPAGTLWYDFWTNEKHEGGKEIAKETTLDVIPLYVKAGSIIPVGPQVQYATEKPWDHLELKVYAGANGNFILYEDEFDNYNYEKGAYTEIPISWNNASRKLRIGARKGAYEGMLKNRKFTVTLQDGTQKSVDYNGKAISVRF